MRQYVQQLQLREKNQILDQKAMHGFGVEREKTPKKLKTEVVINIITFSFFYFQMMTDFSLKKIVLNETNFYHNNFPPIVHPNLCFIK